MAALVIPAFNYFLPSSLLLNKQTNKRTLLHLFSLDNRADLRAMSIYMTDCSRCDRSFRTQSARAQHISNSSHHNICDECYYVVDFETAYELREHMIDEHNGCPQCHDTFDSEEDLQEHLYDEHNMCSVCNQCFSSPSNLKYVRFFFFFSFSNMSTYSMLCDSRFQRA